MSGIRLILDDGMGTIGADAETLLPCPLCDGIDRAQHAEDEITYKQISDCYLCSGVGAVSAAVRVSWIRRRRELMARRLA